MSRNGPSASGITLHPIGPIAPLPAPPRGRPCHEPKFSTAFRLTIGGAQLGHPGAALIGDLDPDNAVFGADRHGDRLAGKARAAVPHTVPEQLGHQQGGVILAQVPRAASSKPRAAKP